MKRVHLRNMPILWMFIGMMGSLFASSRMTAQTLIADAVQNLPEEKNINSPESKTFLDIEKNYTQIQIPKHRYIEYFLDQYRMFYLDSFQRMLNHIKPFIPDLLPYLEKYKLPLMALFIPFLEKESMDTVSIDPQQGGFWNLSPTQASTLGLQMNDYLDERLDIFKSSDAVLQQLSKLYKLYEGQWDLTLLAYRGFGNQMRNIATSIPEEISFSTLVKHSGDTLGKGVVVTLSQIRFLAKFYALYEFIKEMNPVLWEGDNFLHHYEDIAKKTNGADFQTIHEQTSIPLTLLHDLNPHLIRQFVIQESSFYIPKEYKRITESRMKTVKEKMLPQIPRGDGLYLNTNAQMSERAQNFLLSPQKLDGKTPLQEKKSPKTTAPKKPKQVKKNKKNIVAASIPDYHIVRKGDSLLYIAGKYRLKLEDILNWNHLDLKSILYINQKIFLKPPAQNNATQNSVSTPEAKKEQKSESMEKGQAVFYQVKEGDTLYSISKIYNISLEQIYALNPTIKKDGKILAKSLLRVK